MPDASSARTLKTEATGWHRASVFEHGSIYWTEAIGAFEVHGVIRDRYKELDWERGVLGYPIQDELPTIENTGRFSVFERGSIYWTEATGAFAVLGRIRDQWKELGWETGTLGYPVSDEYAITGGRASDFQHGTIQWNAATDKTTIVMTPAP